jgi:hypothetical protein
MLKANSIFIAITVNVGTSGQEIELSVKNTQESRL